MSDFKLEYTLHKEAFQQILVAFNLCHHLVSFVNNMLNIIVFKCCYDKKKFV